MKHLKVTAIIVLVFIAVALAGVAVQIGKDGATTSRSNSFQLEHGAVEPQAPAGVRVLDTVAFSNLGLPVRPVTIADTEFSLTVADTGRARVSGLSNVDSMQYDQGMLFVFDTDAVHGFWMKDMRFPLDIIWVDSSGQVVYIEERLSPDTYPRVYKSDVPARYVIELNAGVVSDIGLTTGDQIRIAGQENAAPQEVDTVEDDSVDSL